MPSPAIMLFASEAIVFDVLERHVSQWLAHGQLFVVPPQSRCFL